MKNGDDKLKGYVQMKDPYSGYYVNNNGSIFSKNRNIMMITKIYDRCYKVSLCGEGKSKCFHIYKLVAEYFLPVVKDCDNVIHKNFDSLNDNVSNLQWVNDEDFGIYRQRKIQYDFLKENKSYSSIGDKFPSYCAKDSGEIYGIAKKENVKVSEKYGLYYVMLFTFGHKYANYQLDLIIAETFLPKRQGKRKYCIRT
jgi:sensor histidine kinase YesM